MSPRPISAGGVLFLTLACMLMPCGCATSRRIAPAVVVRPAGLSPPAVAPTLAASVVPPTGWNWQLLHESQLYVHQVWLSPTGATAYGVVFFHLPWPVGPNFVLWGFLQHLKMKDGQATLVARQDDDALPGIRFVADSRTYRIRCNIITRGFQGWAIYTGTRRTEPVNEGELRLGLAACAHTQVIAR